jgi:hypothetical protein
MRIEANAKGDPASLYEFVGHSVDGGNVALATEGTTPSASSFGLANQSRRFQKSPGQAEHLPPFARNVGVGNEQDRCSSQKEIIHKSRKP